MNAFAKKLSVFIKSNPLSVSEIARKTEISRPSLYDLVNGKSLPKKSTLFRLCQVLNLNDQDTKFLESSVNLERLRTSRKERIRDHQRKQDLIGKTTDLLLAKGHEIARSTTSHDIDLIIRLSSGKRIPILAQPTLIDRANVLGTLLGAMHDLETSIGYLCVPSTRGFSRSLTSLFAKYGIKIVTSKSLLRELS